MTPPVLVITSSFPRDSKDFAGRFVAEVSAAVRAEGHPVRVLAPVGTGALGLPCLAFSPVGSLLGGEGAPDRLMASPLRHAASALGTTGALLAATRRHARAEDALIAHWLVPAGLAAACSPARARLLYAHGGDVALLERLPGGAALARWLVGRADGLVCVSEDLKARLSKLTGHPLPQAQVLPMGVATPAPDAAARARFAELKRGRLVVVTVGRLVAIKGLDVLAQALAGRPWRWLVAGEGPEQAALAQKCRTIGVDAVFLGRLSPGARDALLQVADAFALPSRPLDGRVEGTPVSLLEALVAGCPTVASATGGVEAVAKPASALLVPPNCPTALGQALDALTCPARRAVMGRAHQDFGQRFLWSRLGPAHAKALKTALCRARR